MTKRSISITSAMLITLSCTEFREPVPSLG